MKENFYHGLLLGILRGNDAWIIKSNKESGTGYADIILEIPDKKIGCVFEMKYAQIYRYGVACYKKDCKIKKV